MFSYILFDLDGTLTNPKIGITSCVQYALKDAGINVPNLDELEVFIGPPLGDSFKAFYGFSEERAQKAIEKYRERFSKVGIFENEVYEGVPKLLAGLKAQGKKIAVASSKPTVYVKRILEHFELEQYFDVILGSELDGRRSAKEEVVEEVLRQMVPGWDEAHSTLWTQLTTSQREAAMRGAISYLNVAMVGDRKFDIQGAHAFGLVGVGVQYGFAKAGELEAEGAEYLADTVETLFNILSQ